MTNRLTEEQKLQVFDLYPPQEETPVEGEGSAWAIAAMVLMFIIGLYIGWFACKAFGNANATLLQSQALHWEQQ